MSYNHICYARLVVYGGQSTNPGNVNPPNPPNSIITRTRSP